MKRSVKGGRLPRVGWKHRQRYLRRIEFEIEKPEKLISQIRGQKLIKKDRTTSLSLSICNRANTMSYRVPKVENMILPISKTKDSAGENIFCIDYYFQKEILCIFR